MTMTTTIYQNRAHSIFIALLVSSHCLGMEKPLSVGPMSYAHTEEGPLWSCKTLLYTSHQNLEVKTQTLLGCKSLLPLIKQGHDAIPLPGIGPYELVHVAACLYAMHNTLHTPEEGLQDQARNQLKAQTDTPHKLHIALMAANYFDHEALIDWCQNRWATCKYAPHDDLELPMELDVEIGGRIIERTPLFGDISSWKAQEIWLNPQQTIKTAQGSVWCVASNKTGTQIATGDWLGNIQLYAQDNPVPIIQIYAHHNAISTIAFTDDDKQVVTCAQDGTIGFWDLATGALHSEMRCNNNQAPFVFKAHMPTQQFAYDEDAEIVVCYPHSEEEKILAGHTSSVRDIAFSPDGTLLASGGNDCVLKLWDLNSAQCLASLITHTKDILCVEFSPDGSLLASGSKDRTIAVHDVFSQELRARLQGHSDKIWSVIISPDNQFVYSGSVDGTVKIWHLPTRTLIKNLVPHYRSSIQSMILQPQGTLVTVSHKGYIHFWALDRLITPILALQRFMKRNSTIDQALMINDAYEAPQREPLDCSNKREREVVFESLHPDIQKMLVKHLHVKPPEKKHKAQQSKRRSPTPSASNMQQRHTDSHYSRK